MAAIDNRKRYYAAERRNGAFARWIKSTVGRLIVANIAVFALVRLVYAAGGGDINVWLSTAAPARDFILQPWGVLTYMFVHTDVLHLLFNMMWLWGFGAIMTNVDDGRTLVLTYVVSGLGGALFFVVTSSAIATTPMPMLGASASVLGVIAGSAVRRPRMKLDMLLFGTMPLWVIAAIAVLLCGVAAGWGNYPVIAVHLGGAVSGISFVWLRFRPRRTSTKTYRPKNVRQHQRRGLNESEQAELDNLLIRVHKSGYKNLSTREQRRLFELSRRIQK